MGHKLCIAALALILIFVFVPSMAIKRETGVTPAPEPISMERYGQIKTDGEHFRLSADENSFSWFDLYEGEVVKILQVFTGEDGKWWMQIESKDGTGYVHADSVKVMRKDEIESYLEGLNSTPTPEPTTTPTPTLKPTPSQTPTLSASQVRDAKYSVGNYVTFGTYPQTEKGNDSTPIEWLVLARDGNKALLISRYGLDAQPYNWVYTDITWEKCTLRTWLNGTFLNKAFTAQEQEGILVTNVDNSTRQGYSGWRTSGENNTRDKVFLLSYAEANKYFGVQHDNVSGATDNMKSRISPTSYARKQGAVTNSSYQTTDGTDAGWWWLRSHAGSLSIAAFVYFDGSLGGGFVYYDGLVVRPALWVNLESDIF